MPARTRLRRAGMLCRPSWQAVSATLQSRSNQIRNNGMIGAVAGTPGTLPTNWAIATASGLSTTVFSPFVANGIEYIDLRIFGTSSGLLYQINDELGGIIAAVVGQTWTESQFLAIVGGSIANITTVYFGWNQQNSVPAAIGGQVSSDIKASLTSSLTRFTYTATTNQAATAWLRPILFAMEFSSGVAIDITLRIGCRMLHQGAAALSPIRTAGAARSGIHVSRQERV